MNKIKFLSMCYLLICFQHFPLFHNVRIWNSSLKNKNVFNFILHLLDCELLIKLKFDSYMHSSNQILLEVFLNILLAVPHCSTSYLTCMDRMQGIAQVKSKSCMGYIIYTLQVHINDFKVVNNVMELIISMVSKIIT